MTKCPCHGCTSRTITCHATCNDYKNWRVEFEALNDKIKEDKDIAVALIQRQVFVRETYRKRHTRKI